MITCLVKKNLKKPNILYRVVRPPDLTAACEVNAITPVNDEIKIPLLMFPVTLLNLVPF